MPESLIQGHVLDELKKFAEESIHCCITSPPYWGLRKYDIPDVIFDGQEGCEHEWEQHLQPAANGIVAAGGMSGETLSGFSATRKPQISSFCSHCHAWRGQLGLEPTIDLYLKHLLQIMDECKRVLRNDGTMWVNIGDSYAGSQNGRNDYQEYSPKDKNIHMKYQGQAPKYSNKIPSKSLCLIPERFSIEMINRGWILRNKIIWHKQNCMPESVKDRLTVDFEPIFFFVKNRKYWFDADSIKLPASADTHARYARGRSDHHKWANGGPGDQTIAKSSDHMVKVPNSYKRSIPGRKDGPGQDRRGQGDRTPGVNPKAKGSPAGCRQNESFSAAICDLVERRNKRTVWTVATQPYSEAHFATFPEKLVEPMIKAGCPVGGTVLDPFCGSGTVMRVAERLQRKAIGIDLGYQELSEKRRKNNQIELIV